MTFPKNTSRSDPAMAFAALPSLACLLWDSHEGARGCPRGTLNLIEESDTGLLFNSEFNPDLIEYQEGYENSLSFSHTFSGYLKDYAKHVVAGAPAAAPRIAEIGCGDGEFLELAIKAGAAAGMGIEPSWKLNRETVLADGRIQILPQSLDAATAPQLRAFDPDLVISRQVLEHVTDPVAFLTLIRESLAPKPVPCVIEVPSATFMYKGGTPWEVIYEHRSYFTEQTLGLIMEKAGYEVTGMETTFNGLFISATGKPNPAARVRSQSEDSDLAYWRGAWKGRLKTWKEDLAQRQAAGQRIALWGAGARGIMFLNIADPGNYIGKVIDLNPRKYGFHAAGSGHKISPPSDLVDYQPEMVIVMNPVYEEEIRSDLAKLGLNPEICIA